MEMMEITFATCIALTVGLTEFVKRLEIIPKKYMVAISLVFGLLFGIFYVVPGDIQEGIFQGLVIGLSSSGLFSGVKNVKKGVK